MRNKLKTYLLLSGVIVSVIFIGAAATANAAALSAAQVEAVIGLLQSFGVDPATISQVQTDLGNQGSASTTPADYSTNANTGGETNTGSGSSCAAISNGLHLGSDDHETNGDVSRLQTFLKSDPSVYPEGLVTGYYGKATEDAVRRWQAALGIVSGGDASSTGYGAVGPKTRDSLDGEIERECEQGDTHSEQSGNEASTTKEIGNSENENGSGTSALENNNASSTENGGYKQGDNSGGGDN